MTDKEKAQAYDNVVNKLKKFIQQGVEPLITKNDVQDFFPELAESNSEDERIRKSLIRNFTNQHSSNFPTADGFTREQILAWLEKQGKQKSIDTCDSSIIDGKEFPASEKRDFGYP